MHVSNKEGAERRHFFFTALQNVLKMNWKLEYFPWYTGLGTNQLNFFVEYYPANIYLFEKKGVKHFSKFYGTTINNIEKILNKKKCSNLISLVIFKEFYEK